MKKRCLAARAEARIKPYKLETPHGGGNAKFRLRRRTGVEIDSRLRCFVPGHVSTQLNESDLRALLVRRSTRMAAIRHGIDHIDLKAFAAQCANRHFEERCFTEAERSGATEAPSAISYFAGRFAAKEALLKALGTGWRDGVSWHDIEVLREPSGAPRLQLHGAVSELAKSIGVVQLSVSISHTDTVAMASVIALIADAV